MVVNSAAPATTGSKKNLVGKKIHQTLRHSFSNIIGDVRNCAKVMVAPGTSIRADKEVLLHRRGTSIQDGAIYGVRAGLVVGDDKIITLCGKEMLLLATWL